MKNKMVSVKEWFRVNKIRDGESYFPQVGEVTRETEKAVLIDGRFWAPKSAVVVMPNNVLA